ncbi:hypothetical protein ACLK2I_07095 [Escherichia coli]
MPSDWQSAIEAQNVQVTAGKIGALPSPNTQQLTATVRAQSRLQTVDQFEKYYREKPVRRRSCSYKRCGSR